jgi:hypothetical protein
MKKVMIALVLVVLLVPFSACEEELPAGEELMSRVFEAMEGVDSYKEEMDVTMQFYFEGADYTPDMPLSADIAADSLVILDVANEEMAMTMGCDVSGEDEDFTMKIEVAIYLVDGMLYTLLDVPMIPGEWNKSPLPEDYWGKMSCAEMQMKLLEASNFEVIGKERKENVECYVVQMEPDLVQLFKMIIEHTILPAGAMLDEEFDMSTDMVKNCSVKMWIDKEEYLIIYAEAQFDLEVTPEMFGEYGGEGMMSANATMNMRAYDYNQPVGIILPAEAEEATEIIMY